MTLDGLRLALVEVIAHTPLGNWNLVGPLAGDPLARLWVVPSRSGEIHAARVLTLHYILRGAGIHVGPIHLSRNFNTYVFGVSHDNARHDRQPPPFA